MICGNCGAHLPENADYCPNCGSIRKNVPAEPARRSAPGGTPPKNRPSAFRTVSMGTYFLWWTVALFSNAEIVCFVLSLVFAFSSGNRNRANFFRAVLLFKLLLLFIGGIAVLVLVLSGFSFTALLNQLDFDFLEEIIEGLF